MASASLLKLLYSGLQDDRLLPPKGLPKIEDFQKVYVKTGRFTTEWCRVEFDNRPAFGVTSKATLQRRGHLITRAYLVATLPDIRTPQIAARAAAAAQGKAFLGPTFGWTNSIGHALVSQAQVTIAGAPIDTLDGKLMEVMDEFHTPLEKVTTVNRMIGRHDNGFNAKSNGWDTPNQEVYVPLPFWFNRGDPSEALPIDAIGADQVQIGVTFSNVEDIYTTTSRTSNASEAGDQSAGGVCVQPKDGKYMMPKIQDSPFYISDTVGSQVPGLNGNPTKSQSASSLGFQFNMPANLNLVDAYLLLEYVYLDRPEANRIRLGDISYPMVQHYAINPTDTKGLPSARIQMRIPNCARDLYFFCHRQDADLLNAPFLATRDLSGVFVADVSGVGPIAPWWPDASGLNTSLFRPLIPAYSIIDSEPLNSLALIYEGRFVRYGTDSPAFFRSILPSFEDRKSPWHNKYYYHIPFGTSQEEVGISNPMGHANLDKITRLELSLGFQPFRGSLRPTDVPNYRIYVWAETYNILRVYGGRAGLLFAY